MGSCSGVKEPQCTVVFAKRDVSGKLGSMNSRKGIGRVAGWALACCMVMPAAHAQVKLSILAPNEWVESNIDRPADAIRDTHLGQGKNDIALAWLVEPTSRNGRGALGELVEAGGVKVRLRTGETLHYRVSEDSLIEDIYARVYDVDGDGRDEVMVVRTALDAGSSLLILGVREGKLVPVAETPYLGKGRWLNPIGVADTDGDGRPEILLVADPHAAGTLLVYRLEAGKLNEVARMPGFSNHVDGSRAMGLAAMLDVDSDKYLEVILPTRDRRALRVIQLHEGSVFESNRVNLPSPAAGDFEVRPPNGLIVPLADGRRVMVRFQ